MMANEKTLGRTRSYGSIADHSRLHPGQTELSGDMNHPAEKRYARSEKPDGGWGWLVVAGVAVSNMTSQAIISVFGLLFSERLAELGIETGGAATILSMQTTVLNLSGFLTGPVIKQFSYRKVCLAGAVLVVAGLLLTTLANSLWSFIFTYSLFTGLGLGLLYPSTFVAINSYFSTKRGLAVGISVAGTGVGQMLLPLLLRYLLDEYGFRGTVLILAAISSHSVAGAALYQPVKWHMKRPQEGEKKKTKEKTSEEPKFREKFRRFSEPRYLSTTSLDTVIVDLKEVQATQQPEEPGDATKEKNSGAVKEVTAAGGEERASAWRGMWARLVQTMDLDLLRSPSFINLVMGLGLVYVANQSFQMLFPFFIEDLGYLRSDVADCMSVLSGADILGRLLIPVITDSFKIKSRTVFFMGAAISALFRSALVMQSQLLLIMVFASLTGLIRSSLVVNFNLSISEYAQPEKLPAALGLHMVFKGVCIITFGPLVGFVRDFTQSYPLCIHILSLFFLVLPFVTWFLEVAITKVAKR